MRFKILIFTFFFLLLVSFSYATDEYKPYLHKATVPEHPEVRLFGQYQTNLFPGSATYTYNLKVPAGTHGLQPNLGISYNSQSVSQRPGILGAGWLLTSYDYIYRDINSTPTETGDDKFLLILDGSSYELLFNSEDSQWHTEVEYNFKINKLTNGSNEYWELTKKNGVKYRFGYNSNSELDSNSGHDYALRWLVDEITDTFGNKIYYSYLKNPYTDDSGAIYLDKVEYNNDKKRRVEFKYETTNRPDRRRVYDQGNLFEESRRINDILVYADDNLVRRYHIDYTIINPALTSIETISYYGSDNTSLLHNISFDYYTSEIGFEKQTSWIPPELFSNDNHNDYGVRLVDLNNDGFIDIVQAKTNGSLKKVWINNKLNGWELDSSWTLPEYIVNLLGYDDGVRFEDVNQDGFTDLIRADSGIRKVYFNTGSGFVENLSWTFPVVDFVDSTGNDLGVRLVDINADGKVDLIKAKSTKAIYLNNGQGWILDSLWAVPEDFTTSEYKDRGLRLVDLNSDGLIDIIKGNSGSRTAWLNNGTGFITSSTWTSPVDFMTSTKPDNGVRFVDVNGDGLIDIIEDFFNGSSSTKGAWINNGHGWTADTNWQSPEAFTKDGFNVGRRLADINGDGLVDIIVSHQDSSTKYTWTKNKTIPYLLKQITNEYGGITTVDYKKSTQFNNTENELSQIGFNIWVVSNVTAENGMADISNGIFDIKGKTSYNYAYGKYNYEKSEFRGFGKTTEETADKKITHYFHQDNPRRGKEYQTELYDLNDNIYSKSVSDYNYTFKNGIYNLSLSYTTNYMYDGATQNPIITNKSYNYDWYGNLWSMTDWGDVSVDGDEKYYKYSYAMNPTYWVMDRVSMQSILDEEGNKVSQVKYYYDNQGLNGVLSNGAVTKIERWNSNGDNSFGYYEYDDYGNVIEETDSLGYKTDYSYDVTGTYAEKVINALGHITYFDYNFGTGNLNWQEKNNIKSKNYYDVFGRIERVVNPYDSFEQPTKRYYYTFDGTTPEKVAVSLKSTANNTLDKTFHYIIYYYDGFGNVVQIKKDLEDKQIVKNIFYDSSFRVKSEQNPYFAAHSDSITNVSSLDYTTNYTYDTVDRVVRVTNPDNTNKTVVFNRLNITDYDENGNKHMYMLDALGRIVKVFEFNTLDLGENIYVTNYEYDANDNLIKIIDNENNEFKFYYDSFGRKIGMDDPDLGSWSYEYDTNDNLLRQTDARGKSIELKYDELNRIISKNSDNVNMSFGYDGFYYGTLSNITMNDILLSYSYDKRYRVSKLIMDVGSFEIETNYLYDSQDRLVSKGGLSELDFIYNALGSVKKIPGYIDDSSYNAYGSILNRSYSNNLVQSFNYNLDNNRLINIGVGDIMNLNYSYDSAGNILGITDSVSNLNHILKYDNLDRLVEATISDDRYVYGYNSLGNIMKIVHNNESKKFTYEGSQAHAPSIITEGAAGVDVYNPQDLDSESKNRVYELFLVNDNADNLSGVNVSVDFGNGHSFAKDGIIVDNNIMMLIQTNYTNGGDYWVNVSSGSAGISDSQSINTKFGTRAKSLKMIHNDYTNTVFEFVVTNDLIETVHNVSWNCSDGITSIYSTEIDGKQSLYDYFAHNYSSPGQKTITCTVNSNDGTESKTIMFNVVDLEIEDYDILTFDISRRVVTYNVKNYFKPVSINISMATENDSFSRETTLNSNEDVMVFIESNYSTDGQKVFEINVSSDNYSERYVDNFKINGVTINNYARTEIDHTNQVFVYDIINNWHDSILEWNLTEPGLGNSVNLTNGEMLMVIIANNFSSQGEKTPQLKTKTSSTEAVMSDYFIIRPIEIESLQTLSDGTKAVSEIIVKNNMNSGQQFGWQFDSGAGTDNLTSNYLINISNKDIMIFIESNYTDDGVYETKAVVNTTTYNDKQHGVVIV